MLWDLKYFVKFNVYPELDPTYLSTSWCWKSWCSFHHAKTASRIIFFLSGRFSLHESYAIFWPAALNLTATIDFHLNNPKFRFQITPPLTCPPALVMLHFALFYVMLGQGSQFIVPLLLEEPTWGYVNLVKPSKFKIWATIKPTKTDIFWALGKTPFLDCMVPPASRSRYMLCLQSRYFFKPGVMRISLGFLLWQLGYWENWEKIDVL